VTTGHCKPQHIQVVHYLHTRVIKVTNKHVVYVKQQIEKLCAISNVYIELRMLQNMVLDNIKMCWI
jgi:hypothetical protein